MKKINLLISMLMCACLAAFALTMSGCGGGDSNSASTAKTVSGAITAGSSSAQTIQSPSEATISLPANTTITDANGQTLSGSLTTTVGYSTSTSDLPSSIIRLPNNATLAAFLDISVGTAKYFSKAVDIKLSVSPAAAAGDTVMIYSYNTTTGSWDPSDTLTVATDGTVSFTIRHLSIWAAFKSTAPLPGKPKGVSITSGNGQVTVSWTAPTLGAPTSYNLYYAITAGVVPGATGVTKVSVTDASTSKIITGLTNGTTYYFVVAAVNANGEGGISSEASGAPAASLQAPDSPNGVKVTAGTGKVTVTWNTKLTATSYNIYYAATASTDTATMLASGTKVKVDALSADPQATTQSYDVTGLTAGTTYSFVITSKNAAGESGGQTSPKTATPL